MKRFLIAAVALSACAPQAPAPDAAAPDPFAVRYEVRVGQTVLPNVLGVRIVGPDAELITATPVGAPPRLLLGRVGPSKLTIRTAWATGEHTMETWRAGFTNLATDQPISIGTRDVTVAITPPGRAAVTFAFTRCLPDRQEMRLERQDLRAEQDWGVTCERVQRS